MGVSTPERVAWRGLMFALFADPDGVVASMTDDDPTDDGRIAGRNASRNGSVPLRHPGSGPILDRLDDDVIDWLEQDAGDGSAEQSAAAILEVEQIRRERRHDWRFLLNWSSKGKGSEARIRLIRLLVERRLGVTYDDITDRLGVSKRRARDFVKELRDGGVVETEGRPAQIRFVDDELFILATDLAAWY